MRKKPRKLPKFKSEDEEREFWDTHDATDYFDTSQAQVTNVENFHAGLKPITIRFSVQQIDLIRRIARGMDVGYQSLIKVWIDERLLQEKSHRHL